MRPLNASARPVRTLAVPAPHGGHPSAPEKPTVAPVQKAVAGLRDRLAALEYPIRDQRDLLERIPADAEALEFRGGRIAPRELVGRLPDTLFPISSAAEFATKITAYLVHPLMEAPPGGAKAQGT